MSRSSAVCVRTSSLMRHAPSAIVFELRWPCCDLSAGFLYVWKLREPSWKWLAVNPFAVMFSLLCWHVWKQAAGVMMHQLHVLVLNFAYVKRGTNNNKHNTSNKDQWNTLELFDRTCFFWERYLFPPLISHPALTRLLGSWRNELS